MKRVGRVVKVKEGMLERYKELHADPWPEVTTYIPECNIRNFCIYSFGQYLFSYFEYTGTDYEKDMKTLDEKTKDWLVETDRCQTPVEDAEEGDLWTVMEEVFHLS